MSLYYRLKRRLGYDTTRRLERIEPCYKYTVTHLNGETTTFVARRYKTKEGGFAKFYKYKRTGEIFQTGFGSDNKPLLIDRNAFPKKIQLKMLEGIQEIEKEHHYDNKFILEYDMADGIIVHERCIANYENK